MKLALNKIQQYWCQYDSKITQIKILEKIVKAKVPNQIMIFCENIASAYELMANMNSADVFVFENGKKDQNESKELKMFNNSKIR